jgi:hypothetical protein
MLLKCGFDLRTSCEENAKRVIAFNINSHLCLHFKIRLYSDSYYFDNFLLNMWYRLLFELSS